MREEEERKKKKKKNTGHDRFSYPAGISEISHKYWRCVSYALISHRETNRDH